jgi:hypothetical protein
MNIVLVSGRGWQLHPSTVENLLVRLSVNANADAVLFDLESVIRESLTESQYHNTVIFHGETPVVAISFTEWIKDPTMSEDSINTSAILNAPARVPTDHIIIVDARNHRLDLLASALEYVRLAWYPLDAWHPVFALVADDRILLDLLPILSHTFYLQPEVITPVEARVIARAILRRAFFYRLFGPYLARKMIAAERALEKIEALAKKVRDLF